MDMRSLDDVLGDFNPSEKQESIRLTRQITIWVPEEYKRKYDDIQARCSNRFTEKLRDLIIAAIDKTNSKTV